MCDKQFLTFSKIYEKEDVKFIDLFLKIKNFIIVVKNIYKRTKIWIFLKNFEFSNTIFFKFMTKYQNGFYEHFIHKMFSVISSRGKIIESKEKRCHNLDDISKLSMLIHY